jgi:O-antigen ligase
VTRRLKTLLLLCALAAATGVLVAPAGAATPCWKTLINDWYDGRIDGTYPIPCYRQAIAHLPPDVDQYSSAADDIRRALQERISGKKPTGKATGPTGPSGPRSAGGGSGPRGPQSTGGRNQSGGAIGDAINAGSNHADSVPIPLLVLAGIAGLLLIAGGAGLIARRVQSRRLPPPSAP